MIKINKPPHGSMEWRHLRHRDNTGKVVFGASEAGALMGVSEYANLLDLCIEKLSDEPQVTVETPAMRKGNLFEPALGVNAADYLGVELVTPDVMYQRGRFIATLDFIEPTKEELIVECKVTKQYGVASGDDLPPSWMMQGHVQHWVTGAEVWFSVFDKYQSLSVVKMPVHNATIAMLEEQSETIGALLDRGIIPDEAWTTANAQQIAKLKPMQKGTSIEATSTLLDYIHDLQQVKEAVKKLKEGEKTLQDCIAREVGTAETITFEGAPIFTWREQKGRTSLDQDRLKIEHPELFEQYLRTGAPIRVMRIGKNA